MTSALGPIKKLHIIKNLRNRFQGGLGPLYAPHTWGVTRSNTLKNIPPPSRTTSMPNSIAIHLAVWISTENRQTHGLVNSQTCLTPSEACICVNHKYKPRPKIKNPLSHVCSAHQMLSKMVRHSPLAPKTMEEMHF